MKNIQDLSVTDCLKIVRRRIWYVIITTILVTTATVIYVWRIPSLYRSETTIMIASRLVPEEYIGSLVRESASDLLEFVRQQLRSRTFLESIVQEFQLGGGSPEALPGVVNNVLNN